MSSVNVWPSAPQYGEESIYPRLPTEPNNFWLAKINEFSKELDNQARHYQLVAKKYKRAKTFLHYTAVSVGSVSGALSAAGVASGLTGIGMIVAAPLGIIAAVFGFSSTSSVALTGVCKKLDPKIYKHRDIVSLAIASVKVSTGSFQKH